MGPRAVFASGLPSRMSKMTQEVTTNGTYCLQVSCVSAIMIALCASGKDFKEEVDPDVLVLHVVILSGEYLPNVCLGICPNEGGENALALTKKADSNTYFIVTVWCGFSDQV